MAAVTNGILNFIARSRSVWAAMRQPTDEEVARRDDDYVAQGRRQSEYPTGPVEASPQLVQFRLLVGIHQDQSFSAPQGFRADQRPIVSLSARPAPNLGIYATVFDNEIKAKRSFKSSSRLINSCLGLQLVVAAALTAIGAANGSRSAITVFGAINTIIAGFLTYLKGSSLPGRFKYYHHEWRRIREYIEQIERYITLTHNPNIDVVAEVDRIRQMYEAVRADIEANTPDRFVGINHAVPAASTMRSESTLVRPQQSQPKLGSDASSGLAPLDPTHGAPWRRSGLDDRFQHASDLEKGAEAYGKEWLQEREAQAETAMSRAQGLGTHLFADAKGLKSKLEERMREIGQLEKALQEHGRKTADQTKHDLSVSIQSKAREVSQIGEGIQARVRGEVDEVEGAVRRDLAERQDEARHAIDEKEDVARRVVAEKEEAVRRAVVEKQEAAARLLAEREAAATRGIAERAQAATRVVTEHEEAATQALAASGDVARTALGEAPDHKVEH